MEGLWELLSRLDRLSGRGGWGGEGVPGLARRWAPGPCARPLFGLNPRRLFARDSKAWSALEPDTAGPAVPEAHVCQSLGASVHLWNRLRGVRPRFWACSPMQVHLVPFGARLKPVGG